MMPLDQLHKAGPKTILTRKMLRRRPRGGEDLVGGSPLWKDLLCGAASGHGSPHRSLASKLTSSHNTIIIIYLSASTTCWKAAEGAAEAPCMTSKSSEVFDPKSYNRGVFDPDGSEDPPAHNDLATASSASHHSS